MICFAWRGFPQYAARCIRAFVPSTIEECRVVATPPKVPIQGMDKLTECPVHWIKYGDKPSFIDLCGKVPDTLFIDGWATEEFNCLRDQVLNSGGRVFAMLDNNFIFSWKECLKAVRFQIKFRKLFNGYLVPGKSGQKLLTFYGAPKSRVFTGMYSADAGLFTSISEITNRPKTIVFVGELSKRKNIVPFTKAFLSIASEKRRDWRLEICGCGALKDQIPQDSAIVVHDFVQPEQLAAIYQKARIFALPSLEEHWGLVVHEGVLSGCVLLLSKQIGAAEDFIGAKNGVTFDAFNKKEMRQAIEKCITMTDEQFKLAQKESLELAHRISLQSFVNGCTSLINLDR